MKKICFLSLSLLFSLFFSCTAFKSDKEAEVLTAEYSLHIFQDTERGFDVFILLNHYSPKHKVKSIILKNRRFDKIETHQLDNSQVFIQAFLVLESSIIQNFVPPPPDNRKDGIVFEIENREIFKEINFKLK